MKRTKRSMTDDDIRVAIRECEDQGEGRSGGSGRGAVEVWLSETEEITTWDARDRGKVGLPTLCHKCLTMHGSREKAIACCPDPSPVCAVQPKLEKFMAKWARGGPLSDYLD